MTHHVPTTGVRLELTARPGDPTVVFLHGLAGHRGEWQPVIDRLDSGVGVVAPDLRGHGASWVADAPITLDRASFVSDVVAVIERFADQPVVLVGQSMGGVVATLVAHARPGLVRHLVLVEAGMAAMPPAEFDGLRRWFDTWPDRFADEAAAAAFFGADAPSTPAWVAGLARAPTGLAPRFDAGQLLDAIQILAAEGVESIPCDTWTQRA